MADKPPLGAIPRPIWVDLRIKELARAIHLRIENDCIDDYTEKWIIELNGLIEERYE